MFSVISINKLSLLRFTCTHGEKHFAIANFCMLCHINRVSEHKIAHCMTVFYLCRNMLTGYLVAFCSVFNSNWFWSLFLLFSFCFITGCVYEEIRFMFKLWFVAASLRSPFNWTTIWTRFHRWNRCIFALVFCFCFWWASCYCIKVATGMTIKYKL